MLLSKQILQRLTIAFAPLKTNNASKDLLNEICQFFLSIKGSNKKGI